ncbi:MAG: esterase family protein [Verrucomicrobia bacterium]|nr:esterase family protein [Verrucomicrobiota bacterium]
MLTNGSSIGFIVRAFGAFTALALYAFTVPSVRAQAPAPTPTPISTTTILPNDQVTFAISAPQASTVSLLFGAVELFAPRPPTAMTRDANGIWSVTIGPLAPDLYEYSFSVDGVVITDPGWAYQKPQRQPNTSLLLIPGNPPDFIDTQAVPHGAIHEETYLASNTQTFRKLLVYTPPGYGSKSYGPLPVLYLYHGAFDTVYSWPIEGRVQPILDNLLAAGAVVPMIVVMPDVYSTVPGSPNDEQDPNNTDDVDAQLINDIIPFVNKNYKVQTDANGRAIAGLSMGGYQTFYSGLVHVKEFSAIGLFSPIYFPNATDKAAITAALSNPKLINHQIKYFQVLIGSDDNVVLPFTEEIDSLLTNAGVRHTFELVPGGIHSFDVWRPALYNFVQNIFKP